MPSSFHTTHIELVSEHLLFSPTLTTYPFPFFSVFCFLPFLVPSRLMYYILFACAGLSSALPLRDPCERAWATKHDCLSPTLGSRVNTLSATSLLTRSTHRPRVSCDSILRPKSSRKSNPHMKWLKIVPPYRQRRNGVLTGC